MMESPKTAMSQSAPLIEAIRQRPGMYFGSKSLTAFHHFLCGYRLACDVHQIKDDRLGLEIPSDFNEWVAYRARFQESTSGWCKMIVATSKSDEEAFDRFFELLKEHSMRRPRLVAEIEDPVSVPLMEEDAKNFPGPPLTRVQIVTYTHDPGFFALYGSEEWGDRFYPFLSWMCELSSGDWVIHDEEAYRELLRANEEWEREMNGSRHVGGLES
ncbi:MAG: hypothetical protein MUF31_09865 [Akkermansiaceae bacterium]|nr:hypothetical protein [Akkermansiaceae bacterium]